MFNGHARQNVFMLYGVEYFAPILQSILYPSRIVQQTRGRQETSELSFAGKLETDAI